MRNLNQTSPEVRPTDGETNVCTERTIWKGLPFVLLTTVAVCIAAATFVEDAQGTKIVQEWVYGAWWFRLLWAAIAVTGIILMWQQHLWHRFSVCMLHVSFLVILAGALTTALTSKGGIVHLRQHEPVALYMDEERMVLPLPFIIELDSFVIDYYEGTDAHSNYTSRVSYRRMDRQTGAPEPTAEHADISMNNILTIDGWRLYQSSFDDDQSGSWLTATYDPWGTLITYAGYLLLALSAILVLTDQRETFARLLRHPALRRGLMSAVLMAAFCSQTMALPVVKKQQADSLRREQVVYSDRIVPLNTVAIDYVQKLYGRHTFRGLTAEQVMLSWQLEPAAWRDVEIIKLKGQKFKALRDKLGLQKGYISVNDLYDQNGNYRLESLYMSEIGTHSKLEKAIREVDEKLGVVLMLERGTLYKSLPTDGSVQTLSRSRVDAELLYNSIPFTKILFMVNLTLGFLLFFYMLAMMVRQTAGRVTAVSRAGAILLLAAFLFHLVGYVLRWYVAGRIPLSNGYETMIFVSLVTMLLALVMYVYRPSLIFVTFGFLISGFTLLVAWLAQMNPQITALMPVLQSPWLASHVSLIMISYSLFAFISLNALTALIIMLLRRTGHSRPTDYDPVESLTVLSRLLLFPAVMLLAVGIFLGAVWANVSWGTYWSWDPKEAWALISMLMYGVAFHSRSLVWLRRPLCFHIYMLVCMLTLLMTYFGVNYLLGGMHSYA